MIAVVVLLLFFFSLLCFFCRIFCLVSSLIYWSNSLVLRGRALAGDWVDVDACWHVENNKSHTIGQTGSRSVKTYKHELVVKPSNLSLF
jgi:hypothetical protein